MATDASSNEKQKKVLESKGKKGQVFYPEQLPTIYSNHVALLMSNMDLTLDFGVRQPQMTKGGSEPPVVISTRIMMSPQHVKMFAEKLAWIVKEYEKGFGVIPTTPLKK